MNLYFLNKFLKNTQTSNFMKIQSVGAELFHADKQTDMTRLIVAFHNSVNMPKSEIKWWHKIAQK